MNRLNIFWTFVVLATLLVIPASVSAAPPEQGGVQWVHIQVDATTCRSQGRAIEVRLGSETIASETILYDAEPPMGTDYQFRLNNPVPGEEHVLEVIVWGEPFVSCRWGWCVKTAAPVGWVTTTFVPSSEPVDIGITCTPPPYRDA